MTHRELIIRQASNGYIVQPIGDGKWQAMVFTSLESLCNWMCANFMPESEQRKNAEAERAMALLTALQTKGGKLDAVPQNGWDGIK